MAVKNMEAPKCMLVFLVGDGRWILVNISGNSDLANGFDHWLPQQDGRTMECEL